ncbi:CRISPR-associated endonuclease Cas2 [Halodesulfurarchaeum formicicum]|uniref:CRISPR-associated endoribonuclease Cas2 n=1 Tax=Halodesulfurarchaeum formicicum TaxID=1873524 RepID=A0A1J1ADP7_9EURY|nr:CRISPR-associated endonuclease Cas2 [Halodesulfurarchaeum formicicum]APE95705.1 CRISPR-associated protein Cas2 [Halodesulfurarchaeum formicicum]
MHVIVVYDVPADRTHVYRKLLRRRLEHLQQSVFFGELTEGQVTEMKNEIKNKLTPDDAIVVFESTNPAHFDYSLFGSSDEPGSRFT